MTFVLSRFMFCDEFEIIIRMQFAMNQKMVHPNDWMDHL